MNKHLSNHLRESLLVHFPTFWECTDGPPSGSPATSRYQHCSTKELMLGCLVLSLNVSVGEHISDEMYSVRGYVRSLATCVFTSSSGCESSRGSLRWSLEELSSRTQYRESCLVLRASATCAEGLHARRFPTKNNRRRRTDVLVQPSNNKIKEAGACEQIYTWLEERVQIHKLHKI